MADAFLLIITLQTVISFIHLRLIRNAAGTGYDLVAIPAFVHLPTTKLLICQLGSANIVEGLKLEPSGSVQLSHTIAFTCGNETLLSNKSFTSNVVVQINRCLCVDHKHECSMLSWFCMSMAISLHNMSKWSNLPTCTWHSHNQKLNVITFLASYGPF